MNAGRFLSRVGVLVGLMLIAVACTQASPPQASTIPTVKNSTPTQIVTLQPTPTLWGGASAKLGPVPQDCPPGPVPQDVVSNTGPVVGGGPVWAGNFTGPHATLEWLPSYATEFHNQYGWGHKLLWIVEDHVKGLVTVHGANLQDGSPLRPDAEQKVATSTPITLVLNPQDPTITNHVDQWVEFPGALDIPKAGCYYLVATWPGGSWRITFAAGEVSS